MKIEKKVQKNPLDMFLDGMAFIACILLLLITFVVTYSAVVRYLHIRPPIWVLQYTEYGLLWVTFLGAAWLKRANGHIRIDTVITFLSKKTRSGLEVGSHILGCLVTLIIFYFALLHTIDLFQRGVLEVKATNIPKYMIFWIIPFGSLMLFIQYVRDTWNRIQRFQTD